MRSHPKPFLPALAAALALGLAACGGGSGSAGSSALPGPGPAPSPTPQGADIAAWGDSLTSGIGAADGYSYPERLAGIMGRKVFNGGVSGQTSDQIAARQGGAPARLTVQNNTLPGSGSAAVVDQSTFPISGEGPGDITGSLAGVHGTLSLSGGTLYFTRDADGAPQNVPPGSAFHPDTFGIERRVNVLWMGDNNFYDAQGVEDDIAASANFTSGKYIVLSLLNASYETQGTDAYNQKMQINADLARSFAGHYIDIRSILVSRYDRSNAQDVADHANDVPPSSLRNDAEHLNADGYAIVAQQVAAFIQSKGW
ncbi:MAG TPA: hypothetical protein VM369_04230 [Candidatus Binatia bacterium]|nr:hypothetical protein [Candidatus Binatia bacterium]